MEKINLFICCSHLYVPAVLSECIKIKGKCYIYTDKEDIKDLFTHLSIPLNIYFDQYDNSRFYTRLFSDLIRKRKLIRWAKNFSFTNVYFFHEGYCEAANWLMLYIAQRANAVFHYVPISRTETLGSISPDRHWISILREYYCWALWGYKPIYSTKGDLCGIMPVVFYEKLGITAEEQIVVDNNTIANLLTEEEYPSSSIVLLSNPNIYNDEQEHLYTRFLESFIRPLMKNRIVLFKNHPGRGHKVGLEAELKEIPSYISGNLLTKRFNCFMGVNSALLCEAANDGSKSICLVYLVDMDEKIRSGIVEYNALLSEKVEYPKSQQSFEEIINSI